MKTLMGLIGSAFLLYVLIAIVVEFAKNPPW